MDGRTSFAALKILIISPCCKLFFKEFLIYYNYLFNSGGTQLILSCCTLCGLVITEICVKSIHRGKEPQRMNTV